MSRYHFRLETVMRIRRAQEESSRHLVLSASQELVKARAHRDACEARYYALEPLSGPVSLQTFKREEAQAERTAESLVEASAIVRGSEAAMAEAYRIWLETNKRLQALERLDDRRREEHRMEEDRAEMVTVDDLVQARWMSPISMADEPHLDSRGAA